MVQMVFPQELLFCVESVFVRFLMALQIYELVNHKEEW